MTVQAPHPATSITFVPGKSDGASAEQAMKHLEQRYRALVENSRDGLAVFGVDGTIQYVSASTTRILGYSADEMEGRLSTEFVSPETLGTFRAAFEECLVHPHVPVMTQAQVRHRDGSWRDVECFLTNLADEPGIEGIVNNYRDVTEQRRNEELVGWLRVAVDQGPASVVLTNALGRIVYTNDKFLEDTGYEAAEVMGRSPARFQAGMNEAELLALWISINAGKKFRGETLTRRKDGSLYRGDTIISPVRNAAGAITHFLGIQTDITERRAAQLALQESIEAYRRLSEATFDGVIVTQDGVVEEVNPGWLRIFGVSDDHEILKKPIPLEIFSPQGRAELLERVRTGFEGSYEMTATRPDGLVIHLEATTKNCMREGRPARITAVRDVTERRALEAQFRQAQKMEAIGQLAGGVAHDFNNLLTVISANAEMLGQTMMHGDPRERELREILDASRSAARLTRQLLTFSRRQIAAPRDIDLNVVVEHTHNMLSTLIGEDIELVTTLTPTPSTVHADEGLIEQVLMNLAVNARDAMLTGGRLSITTSVVGPDVVPGRRGMGGAHVMLSVSDTGTGMDEATRSRVFEPFFTTKGANRGTGLGLATVYGIVTQAGGTVAVESSPGAGATFRVFLPEVPNAQPVAEAEAPSTRLARGTETVLVVEDGEAVRVVACRMLERLGYTVLACGSGEEALAISAAHATPIHLLITDVVMPAMSGRILAERFAAQRPDAKVLVMSGYTDDAMVRHGVLTDTMAFLHKPFTPLSLSQAVRRVLDS